nr:RNA-directed DNA polymerase, eukaryota, reverse transcriptase zinc-binding domain protein [Tanacetum cinerariifolium]
MGGPRSKEDEVHKISTSLFISIFSDQFTAKDLFNTCKQYGHVVDAFIPNKRSKAGKRFGFVRFIKRSPLNNESGQAQNKVGESSNNTNVKAKGVQGMANSYVHVVKGGLQSVNREADFTPALVLNDECCNSKDLDHALFGRVKEFAFLANLNMVLKNEGFDNITIKYMGDFWVLLEFNSEDSKKLFQSNKGDASWFTQLIKASMDFNIDERVAWVEIEGVPFKMWYVNTFRRIASKWGTLIHVDGQEEDCFHRKRLCLITKVGRNIVESFKIVFHGKVFWIRAKEVPGWVPDFMDDSDEEYDTYGDTTTGGSLGEDDSNCGDVSDVEEVSETKFEEGLDAPNVEEVSTGQENKHSEDPFNFYDLLNKKNKSHDKGNKSDNSLKYPPGFTPVNESEVNEKKDDESKKDSGDCSQRNLKEEENLGTKEKCLNKNSIDDAAESVCSGQFKKSEAPQTGGSILILMDELVKVVETPKSKIREWNKDKKKNASNRKLRIKEKLVGLDKIIDKGESSFEVVKKRLDVFNSLQELENLQSLETAQKSKVKWAIERDENSKFYHGILNKKRNQLNIRGILIDGIWTEDPHLVKHEFLQHFKKRFDKPVEQRFHLDMNFPRTLSSDQQADLEIKVSREEIKRLVWDCGTDKSPGPDGFTFGFYRRYWKIVEKRHISLIGSLYKILANRLVVVLGDIVNEVQSTFVTDRQILDGPFILNELFQWCKLKKKQSLIFKVDFEMAYDSVRWEFLDDVLRKFGFGEKWCNWIQSCLRSSRVIESLHISFQRVVEAGMFKGVTFISSLQISHMFYADDAVIVGQCNDVNIDTIIHVLECFFYASGMRINKSKSKLMGITVKDDKVELAASMIGCLMLKPPFSYLGSKVGGLMSRSMPIYLMSIFKVPMSVLKRLESIRGSFFDGHDINSKKTSWVKWKNVLASKEKGGLGVSSLYASNRGLMFKWVWRIYAQNNSLWAKVIKAIHGDDGKVGKKTKSVFQSIWIDIVHEMESLKNQDIDILKCMKFKLGNGAHTAFWNEVWCGDIALKNLSCVTEEERYGCAL